MGWYVRLFRLGPIGYTWHPKRRRGRYYYANLPGGRRCPHRHRTMAAAEECARKHR